MRSTTMAENNLSPTWMKMAVLFSFLAYAHGDEGMCLWYGNCGPNPISPTNECLNCYAGKSGKPPKPLLDADSKTQLFGGGSKNNEKGHSGTGAKSVKMFAKKDTAESVGF